MTRYVAPHLPLAPLVTAAQTAHAQSDTGPGRGGHACPTAALALVLDVTARTVHRWQSDGLPLRAAEDACDRLRLHPAEVWGPDAYYLAAEPLIWRIYAA